MNSCLFSCSVVVLAFLSAPSIKTQAVDHPSEEQSAKAYGAHQADNDYLLGDWKFTPQNEQYGNLEGRWSAVLLETGQIIDEFRVLEKNGAAIYAIPTVRSYIPHPTVGNSLAWKAAADCWILEQKFAVAGGSPVTMRIPYYDSKPDSFSWSADRSTDGGKTWIADFQRIEAYRLGPARPLAPAPTAPK